MTIAPTPDSNSDSYTFDLSRQQSGEVRFLPPRVAQGPLDVQSVAKASDARLEVVPGVKRSPAPIAIVQQTRPFQFPSLDHMEEAVLEGLRRKQEVEGESARTFSWRRDGYRSFHAFLRMTHQGSLFLGGQLETQRHLIEGWVADLRKRSRSHSTVNGYCRGLLAAFAVVAEPTGMTHPMLGFAIPQPGETRRPRLHPKRITELLEAVTHLPYRSDLERHRNALIVGCFALVGLRKGELLALKTGDVNLTQWTIHIAKAKGRHGGKDRDPTIPAVLRPYVERYIRARIAMHREEAFFFVSTVPGRGICTSTLSRLYQRVEEKIGMHLSSHMLRRTCEDFMRWKKVPAPVAMRQLGHTSMAMYVRYSDVTEDEQWQVIGSIDSTSLTPDDAPAEPAAIPPPRFKGC